MTRKCKQLNRYMNKLVRNLSISQKELIELIEAFDYSNLKSTDLETRKLAALYGCLLVSLLTTCPKANLDSIRNVRGPFVRKDQFLYISFSRQVDCSAQKNFMQETAHRPGKQIFNYTVPTGPMAASLVFSVPINRVIENLSSPRFLDCLPDPETTSIFIYMTDEVYYKMKDIAWIDQDLHTYLEYYKLIHSSEYPCVSLEVNRLLFNRRFSKRKADSSLWIGNPRPDSLLPPANFVEKPAQKSTICHLPPLDRQSSPWKQEKMVRDRASKSFSVKKARIFNEIKATLPKQRRGLFLEVVSKAKLGEKHLTEDSNDTDSEEDEPEPRRRRASQPREAPYKPKLLNLKPVQNAHYFLHLALPSLQQTNKSPSPQEQSPISRDLGSESSPKYSYAPRKSLNFKLKSLAVTGEEADDPSKHLLAVSGEKRGPKSSLTSNFFLVRQSENKLKAK